MTTSVILEMVSYKKTSHQLMINGILKETLRFFQLESGSIYLNSLDNINNKTLSTNRYIDTVFKLWLSHLWGNVHVRYGMTCFVIFNVR